MGCAVRSTVSRPNPASYPRAMEKRYLMTPGPTPVPPQVLAAEAEPMVHHRGPDFQTTYTSVLERLKQVHRTANPVLLFAASGTGAMDSAVSNLTRAGEKAAVVVAGSFGERWTKICAHYDLEVERIDYTWGEVPNPAEIGAAVAASGAKYLFCTQSETSTGVVVDVQAIKAAAGDAIVVVDAISSLGAVPLEVDAWGIDVTVSGSQKALMCPPGLATATAADHVWEQLPAKSRTFYFDWRATKKAQESFDAAFTPAVSLIRGMDVALGMILDAGLDEGLAKHVRLGRAARAGVKAMGLELFSPDDDTSAVVTAVRCPEGVDGSALLRHLRDRHGVTLAPGQGALKGKIVRIGHIGWFDIFDIATALSALELSLTELGATVERGVAATAAFDAYEQTVTA